jgi:hypothetical protein
VTRRRFLLPVLLAASLLASCDAPTSSWPRGVELELAWTAPTAPLPPNSVVIWPPRVRVLSASGRPRPNTRVAFSVVSGGGEVLAPFASTDADGYATTFWETGLIEGTQELIAFVPGANDGQTVSFIVEVSSAAVSAEPTHPVVELSPRSAPRQTAPPDRPSRSRH